MTVPYGCPPDGSRVSRLSSVVFPAPDGPMSARTEPAGTEADKSLMSTFGGEGHAEAEVADMGL